MGSYFLIIKPVFKKPILGGLFQQLCLEKIGLLKWIVQHIICAFSNEADEIRYWKIEGFGQVPCGGTHIERTSELGALKLKKGQAR